MKNNLSFSSFFSKQTAWFESGHVARILMELTWVTSWYLSFLQYRAGWIKTTATLFLILWGSSLLVRLLNLRKDLRFWIPPTVFLGWILMTTIVSLNWLVWPQSPVGLWGALKNIYNSFLLKTPDLGIFWHLIFLVLIIWRGVRLGNSKGDLHEVYFDLRIGIVMMLLFSLLFNNQLTINSILPAVIFLFLGLIAMGFTRIADIAVLRGGKLPSQPDRWWLTLIAGSLVLSIIAVVLGGILRQPIQWLIFAALLLMIVPIGMIMIVIAFPVILLFAQSTGEINDIMNQLLSNMNAFNSILPQERLMKNWGKIHRLSIYDYLIPFGIFLFLLIIIFFIFLDLKSENSRIRKLLEEENVTNLFTRSRQSPDKELKGNQQQKSRHRSFAEARIRRIYADLMELCKKLAHPRQDAITPQEFLPDLQELFPDYPDECKQITLAYQNIRYGEIPESQAEVNQIELAWRKIYQAGKSKVSEKRKQEKERQKF